MENRTVWLLLGLGTLGVLAWVAATSKTVQAAAGAAVSSLFDSVRALLQRLEGLRLTAYQDQAGKWTIGYGHLIKPGEPYVPYGIIYTITPQQADELLAADTAEAQACVDANVVVPLTDDQRAALVSFAYNVGCGALISSTLLRLVNAGDFAGAAAEFDKWNHVRDPQTGQLVVSAGLTDRRAAERTVFEMGTA
jgi:lysozyme